MKFSLRVTIATALLGILIVTHLVALVTAQRGAAFLVRDLSDQVVRRTSDGVQEYVARLLRSASEQSALTARYLRAEVLAGNRPLSSRDFPDILVYFGDVLRVHPEMGYVSLGIEATGEYCHAVREPTGAITEQECVRPAPGGRLRLSEYRRDGKARRVRIRLNPDSDYDPRTRPYYRLAKSAGEQAWTPTYPFRTLDGAKVDGITCATPVHGPDGRFRGVVSVDFTLESLGRFLKARPIGETGFPFIVEVKDGGERSIIASGERPRAESATAAFAPAAAAQPRVAVGAFLKSLPAKDLPKAFQSFRFGPDGDYRGSVHPVRGDRSPRWLLCTLVPEDELTGKVRRSLNMSAAVVGAGVLVGILASLFLAGAISLPIKRIARETERIRNLELEPSPPLPSHIREVGDLSDAVERMKSGLRSFERFVPSDYVRWLMATGREAAPGGERRAVTAFFADIAGSTQLAEQLSPDALIALLGDYFNAVSAEIAATGGTVDKYNGDEVMAFWNAPVARPDHARAACIAALRCRERLAVLRASWEASGLPPVFTRIGLCTGEVTVGTVGSDARLNYTILGDTVNVAKRIEGLSKCYGTSLLASDSTVREAGSDILSRPIDLVAVTGRQEPVLVHELLGVRGEASPDAERLADLCTRAWELRRAGNAVAAVTLLEEALVLHPSDAPTAYLLAAFREASQGNAESAPVLKLRGE